MKDTITDTFLRLLDEYEFKDITVTMICSAVPVSRTAFYRYFKDKNGIQEYFVCRDYEKKCLPIFRFHLKEQGTKCFFSQIREQKEIYNKIFKIDNGLTLYRSLKTAYRIGFEKRKEFSYPSKWSDRTFDPEVFFEYACSGIAAVVVAWMRNGMKPSEERIAKDLYIMMSNTLEDVRDHYT